MPSQDAVANNNFGSKQTQRKKRPLSRLSATATPAAAEEDGQPYANVLLRPQTTDGHIGAVAATAFASAASPAPFVQPIRLIPIEAVGDILGFKNSAVQEMVARGDLPPPIKFGTSRRASARWIEQEIFAFAWSLAAQRPSPTSKNAAKKPHLLHSKRPAVKGVA